MRRRARLTPFETIASLSTFAGQIAGRVLLGAFGPSAALFGDALLGFYLDDQIDRPGGGRAPLEQELSEEEKRIEEFRLARRRVMNDMRRKVDTLEGRLPHSRLTGRH